MKLTFAKPVANSNTYNLNMHILLSPRNPEAKRKNGTFMALFCLKE